MPDQMRLAYLAQNIMEYITEFLEGQTTMAGVCNGYKYTVKFSRVGPESVEEVEKGVGKHWKIFLRMRKRVEAMRVRCVECREWIEDESNKETHLTQKVTGGVYYAPYHKSCLSSVLNETNESSGEA